MNYYSLYKKEDLAFIFVVCSFIILFLLIGFVWYVATKHDHKESYWTWLQRDKRQPLGIFTFLTGGFMLLGLIIIPGVAYICNVMYQFIIQKL